MLRKTTPWILTAIFCAAAALLSGCDRIREKTTELLWDHSGIPENAEYQQYLELDASGDLDENGLYRSEVIEQQRMEEASEPQGSVRISFARNDHFLIDYYADEAMTIPLKGSEWRLDPGDAVYASAPAVVNQSSNLYRFSEFRVLEFDMAGNAHELASVTPDLPGLVFRIPEDFTGTELSVIPLGKYLKRTVTLNAGFFDENGRRSALDNIVWEINGTRYGSGSVQLDPMGVYRVVCDYSAYKDQWYFLQSSPESYWNKDSDGTITFFEVPSDTEHVDYQVSLHRYGFLKIGNGIDTLGGSDSLLDNAASLFLPRHDNEIQNPIELLQVNGITVSNDFSNSEISIPKLKSGDEVLIRVPEELKVIGSGLHIPQPESKNQSMEYRITIPDTNDMVFSLTVGMRNSESGGLFHPYSVKNGVMRVYDALGVEYTEGSELPYENEKVTVEITPDSGYCIYGKNIKNNSYRADMKYSDLTAKCDGILNDHPIRPGIKVTIDTSDDLGDCVFWSGNAPISGNVVLREDQDLQFDYMLRQDSGYELILTKEDAGEAINVWSPYAATRQMEVTDDLNGKTLRCRDFVTLKEGAPANDAASDLF